MQKVVTHNYIPASSLHACPQSIILTINLSFTSQNTLTLTRSTTFLQRATNAVRLSFNRPNPGILEIRGTSYRQDFLATKGYPLTSTQDLHTMPRLSSSTPSSFSITGLFKKNAKAGSKEDHEEVVIYPGGGSGVSRSRKTNRRRAPPRPVAIRNSSLYGTSSSSSFYNQSSYIDSNNDLYNLEANPSVYFPAPPPRLSLAWDKRHTDIWDDLFDWAETYQASSIGATSSASSSTASRPASRATGGRPRLTCQTQLDLTSAGELKEAKKKRRLSGLFTLGKLALKSEIWSKVRTRLSILSSVFPRQNPIWLCFDKLPSPLSKDVGIT